MRRLNRRQRAQMRRLEAIRADIEAIPSGPCESFEEREERYRQEALDLVKWQVFLDGGARPRPR
jgi:hypothetical protein